jgi:hypothetical protein
MGNDTKQFYNPDDGCVYFFDESKACYRKVCDVGSFANLPFVIKRQIKAVKEDAEQALRLPT